MLRYPILFVACLLAGCTDPPAAEDSLQADPQQASGLIEPFEWSIEFAGHLDTRVCAPSGANSCDVTALPPDIQDAAHEIRHGGAGMWSFDVTLEWTAPTEELTQLTLSVASYAACGDRCVQTVDARSATGGPGLHLASQDVAADGETIGLSLVVSQPNQLTEPAYGWTQTSMDFRLHGTATFTPAAPASDLAA